MASRTALLLGLTLAASPALASDGKWTPDQMLALELKKLGIEVPARKLWDPAKGTGLLAGAVRVDGCSAGFVSSTGLIVTNHHCLFSLLQEHSQPDRNVIEDGFLARSRADELPGKTARVQIPRKFTDVTADIEAAASAARDDGGRWRAIEARQKEIVAACEQTPNARCDVASFDGGVRYVLVEARELEDVRLVWAPPRAVGEYGGEIDNWTWPRHTGDFAIARVYVAPDGSSAKYDPKNVPYTPEHFFPLAARGVKDGDAVMVLGYPGLTYRSLLAEEVAERQELFFPQRLALFSERIEDLRRTTAGSADGAIAVADDLKTLLNRKKNAEGQLAGLVRWDVLARGRAADDAVAAWARDRPSFAGALAARDELRAILAEDRARWHRDFLLSTLQIQSAQPGSKALFLGATVARWARQRALPDADRDPQYMARNDKRLADRIEREQKRVFSAADRALTAAFVRRALALPAGQRIAAIDAAFGAVPAAGLDAAVAALYARSKLLDLPSRMAMTREDEAALRARKDPLVDLGLALDAELTALRERQDRLAGAISRLRPPWRRAVMAHAGKPIAPDANGTLRVTFGRVKGYAPRDGVTYAARTTLAGLLEKHTGAAPFDVPAALRTAAAAADRGPWRDAALGDVPVNFLSDADTTGGNSGSPVVNARGELVGVNFDRVWENVANDFGYIPEVGRNISADARYLGFVLERVFGGEALLDELRGKRR